MVKKNITVKAEVVFQKLSADKKKPHICTVGMGVKEEVEKQNVYFWPSLGVLGNLPSHRLFVFSHSDKKKKKSRWFPLCGVT